MKITLKNNNCKYAAEQMLLTLYPSEKPEFCDDARGENSLVISLSEGKKFTTAFCRLIRGGRTYTGRCAVLRKRLSDELERERQHQRIVKLAFYRAATEQLGTEPVWGALTGIRPGKLMSNLIEAGYSDRAALTKFCADYRASRERAELCLDTARASLKVARELEPGDICLYVGIPFCPTRCAYCSFVSQSVEKSMKLIEPFLQALYRELDATARAVRAMGLRVVSVYFGGGTPTTLSAVQLSGLIAHMKSAFDLSHCREFTVEAGRPDTITAEKLRVLRENGVTRVSVNPQTMSDEVLEVIGRKHTAADVVSALELVRECGGFEVNMDLIAGLPADTPQGFRDTLEKVLELAPENITVHTLSLKKGSRIMLEGTEIPSAQDVGEMLDYAAARLRACGYAPYYLYRQKYMSGGFENIGWSKKGAENVYNICIMEELCSIISMGGGASTKLCTGTGRIERVFAPKYPLEYIQRSDKVVADKKKITDFYSALNGRNEDVNED